MQCEPNLCFSSATKNLEKGNSPKPATLLDTVRSGRRHASRHSVNEPTVFWGKVPTPHETGGARWRETATLIGTRDTWQSKKPVACFLSQLYSATEQKEHSRIDVGFTDFCLNISLKLPTYSQHYPDVKMPSLLSLLSFLIPQMQQEHSHHRSIWFRQFWYENFTKSVSEPSIYFPVCKIMVFHNDQTVGQCYCFCSLAVCCSSFLGSTGFL